MKNSISLYDWCINNDNKKLINEWDIDKNSAEDIHFITIGAKKKVWWLKALGDLYINNDLNPAKAGENGTLVPTPTHIAPPC